MNLAVHSLVLALGFFGLTLATLQVASAISEANQCGPVEP